MKENGQGKYEVVKAVVLKAWDDIENVSVAELQIEKEKAELYAALMAKVIRSIINNK